MLVAGVTMGRRAVMGREGAGERCWFCCGFLAASQRILHPNLASGAGEVLFKGCWQENVVCLLKNVRLFASEVCICVDKPEDQPR